MASSLIDGFPAAATPLAAANEIVLLQGINTVKLTLAQLMAALVTVKTASFVVDPTLCGADIVYNSAATGTFTIPQGLGLGFQFTVIQQGAGKPSYATGAGVTVVSPHGYTGPSATGAMVLLKCIATTGTADTYIFAGDGA